MELIPNNILSTLPKIGDQEGTDLREQTAYLRFFNPSGAGTWYLFEYDPVERLAFGAAHIHEWELGYFSIAELESIQVPPYGLTIERDLHFSPSQVKDIEELTKAFKRILLSEIEEQEKREKGETEAKKELLEQLYQIKIKAMRLQRNK